MKNSDMDNFYMITGFITSIVLVIFALTGGAMLAIVLFTNAEFSTTSRWQTQDWFLSKCREDEVIGIDTRFGPNEVGCINKDEVNAR